MIVIHYNPSGHYGELTRWIGENFALARWKIGMNHCWTLHRLPLQSQWWLSRLTSNPGSMLINVICLTILDGLKRSITLLWILIWNLSQVLKPSPQEVFLVVILSALVGILTGPFTLSSLSLAPLHTLSRDLAFLEVWVILMRWAGTSSSTPFHPDTSTDIR